MVKVEFLDFFLAELGLLLEDELEAFLNFELILFNLWGVAVLSFVKDFLSSTNKLLDDGKWVFNKLLQF